MVGSDRRTDDQLQPAGNLPDIAQNTQAGAGNLCLLTDENIARVKDRLIASGIAILQGPVERAGATGPIQSIYLHDPDGNLVEIGQPL